MSCSIFNDINIQQTHAGILPSTSSSCSHGAAVVLLFYPHFHLVHIPHRRRLLITRRDTGEFCHKRTIVPVLFARVAAAGASLTHPCLCWIGHFVPWKYLEISAEISNRGVEHKLSSCPIPFRVVLITNPAAVQVKLCFATRTTTQQPVHLVTVSLMRQKDRQDNYSWRTCH